MILELVKRWGARRALEKATPDEVEALSSRMEVCEQQTFLEFSLDREFIERLDLDYLGPLRQFESTVDYLAGYQQSLDLWR